MQLTFTSCLLSVVAALPFGIYIVDNNNNQYYNPVNVPHTGTNLGVITQNSGQAAASSGSAACFTGGAYGVSAVSVITLGSNDTFNAPPLSWALEGILTRPHITTAASSSMEDTITKIVIWAAASCCGLWRTRLYDLRVGNRSARCQCRWKLAAW